MFNTNGQFRIFEDSSLNIVGRNNASNADIHSTGDITNVFTSIVGQGTTINIATVAAFEGSNILLGNQAKRPGEFRFCSIEHAGICNHC